MQPTSVQAPSGRAACHAPAGTTTCGRSPATTSGRAGGVVTAASPSAQTESSRGSPGRVLPDLVGIDAVPVRALAGREQVEDRAAGGPGAVDGRCAPRLGEPAALGMSAQSQGGDHGRGSGMSRGYRSRSPFRARSSYRTGMCRSIKTLRRAETRDDRRTGGGRPPVRPQDQRLSRAVARATREAFEAAIVEIASSSQHLLESPRASTSRKARTWRRADGATRAARWPLTEARSPRPGGSGPVSTSRRSAAHRRARTPRRWPASTARRCSSTTAPASPRTPAGSRRRLAGAGLAFRRPVRAQGQPAARDPRRVSRPRCARHSRRASASTPARRARWCARSSAAGGPTRSATPARTSPSATSTSSLRTRSTSTSTRSARSSGTAGGRRGRGSGSGSTRGPAPATPSTSSTAATARPSSGSTWSGSTTPSPPPPPRPRRRHGPLPRGVGLAGAMAWPASSAPCRRPSRRFGVLRAAGHPVAEVNVGGGLGVPARADEPPVDLDAYAAVLARHLGPLGVVVACEPGDHLAQGRRRSCSARS